MGEKRFAEAQNFTEPARQKNQPSSLDSAHLYYPELELKNIKKASYPSNQNTRRMQVIAFLSKTISGPSVLLTLIFWLFTGAVVAEGPSFDCCKVEAGSIEEMICKDEGLTALDQKLSEVYTSASEKAVKEHNPVLEAEQRGWIKERNDCWKSDSKRRCIEEVYILRIAELQARYRLVPSTGPVFYSCDGNPRNEVVATFFETDPPTLIAERGDQESLMFLQPSGSGAKYQGRNESLWEHHGNAIIIWGYGSPEMRCTSEY